MRVEYKEEAAAGSAIEGVGSPRQMSRRVDELIVH